MGKQNRQNYLRNCARTVQGQLGLSTEQFKGLKTLPEIEAAINAKAAAIDIRLMQSPDEQLGRLACIANHADVRHLARQVLVPAIAQKIWAELNPKRVLKCRFCDFTVSKFARGRLGDAFDVMRKHIGDDHPEKADQIAVAIYGSREDYDIADIQDVADGFKA